MTVGSAWHVRATCPVTQPGQNHGGPLGLLCDLLGQLDRRLQPHVDGDWMPVGGAQAAHLGRDGLT
jgi:hypothetical protein